MNDLSNSDDPLRRVLNEVSAGRLTVDEARTEVEAIFAQRVRAVRTTSSGNLPTTSKGMFFVGLGVLLFGGIFGAVGGFMGWTSFDFTKGTARTEGAVVRSERSGKNNNHVPIVRYVVEGKPYEVRGQIASNLSPAVGTKLGVLYKTAEPGRAQIDSFTERWLFPTVFGGIGGVVMLGGVGLLLKSLVGMLRRPAAERFTVG